MKTRKIIGMLVIMLLLCLIPTSDVLAAKKICLNSKKVTITKGKTKTIKIRNTKKKVTWKIVSGKKNIKIVKKGKKFIKIKALKKGSSVIRATVGKKKLTCKVIVHSKKKKGNYTELDLALNYYKECYTKFNNNNQKTTGVSMIYLDNDNIPECILWSYGCFSNGAVDTSLVYGTLYCYANGKKQEHELMISTCGMDGFRYIPKSGKFYTCRICNGYGYEYHMYKLTDKISETGVAYDYFAAIYPEYLINGERVSSSDEINAYINGLGINGKVTDLYSSVDGAYNAVK